jgi:hypothetical protein
MQHLYSSALRGLGSRRLMPARLGISGVQGGGQPASLSESVEPRASAADAVGIVAYSGLA